MYKVQPRIILTRSMEGIDSSVAEAAAALESVQNIYTICFKKYLRVFLQSAVAISFQLMSC